ncbi:hypothetical protein BZA05DRAFT_336623 [Tricharina praecox]|uniref:uncharacterized protein n=1 Tax=Tricharina praecox TaxID=43433 RepID=UPI0022209B38|nr:uncharacterized protein BZA05DRAFT_336623 [Tricharina praecox]KAI5853351.1 hypothetical protein BZA05DRAFT_336623 [Tricharina praecox]
MTNIVGLPKYDKDGRELYCICRKPDTGKWMICCDGCEDWYHGECVKVKEEDGNLIDKYYCQHCQTSTQRTTWKRMCRLPHCRKPAAIDQNPPSKYCSTKCGVDYMNKYAIPRSTLSRPQVAALASVVTTGAEFKRLGDHIPTPPRGACTPTTEETLRLSKILLERHALTKQKKRIEQRGRYVELAIERRARILEELQSDPDAGKVTAICGYDTRLALDDLEWDEWCETDEGANVFETEWIPGRDGVCIKKNCRTHKGWSTLFVDEQHHCERERVERFVALRQEERRIRERQKRRVLKDEEEGRVEVEG